MPDFSMFPDKAILKCDEGLVQLLQCPKCGYLVFQLDIIWKRQPNSIEDKGEIESCKFCKPQSH